MTRGDPGPAGGGGGGVGAAPGAGAGRAEDGGAGRGDAADVDLQAAGVCLCVCVDVGLEGSHRIRLGSHGGRPNETEKSVDRSTAQRKLIGMRNLGIELKKACGQDQLSRSSPDVACSVLL